MSSKAKASKVTMIPIEKVNILNPRTHNKKIFGAITDNISDVGLKRPITVTLCHSREPGKEYDLVCGQGRMEAFMACGQTHIPAIIIDANQEQALIMSLVENCARRKHSAIEILQGIALLQNQGYDSKIIAEKTGMRVDYIISILTLLERGEERLLAAVEVGHIPITVAMKIAETPDENMQQALQEIYESKQLRGSKLLVAKKLIENRRRRGKGMEHSGGPSRNSGQPSISAQDVMKVYQREADRKRLLTRKAEIANNRLLFVLEALRRLYQEDHFNTLLRAEGLNTLPKPLADLMAEKGYGHG
jgi:ParB family chromosome partitioning protein